MPPTPPLGASPVFFWFRPALSAQHARGAGFNPQPVHAHVRLRWSFSLWVCCASCQGRLLRRGRVPNVTFESYIEIVESIESIESRKLSVPRRNQQEQLRVQRPLFFLSAAGALLWLVLAVGKRVRPGKAIKHLQGTVFSAEALSRPARPAFLLPFCCRRTPLVGARCGQTSAGPPLQGTVFSAEALPARSSGLFASFLLPAHSFGWCSRARPFGLFSSFLLPAHSFGFFPFPSCCRRTPLVGARCGQTSAAWKSAGSEAFVAGRSLWTDSLAAYWTQTRR